MSNYEVCVILNAQLQDKELEAQIEKLQKQLESTGAAIKAVSKWGRRKLAQPIEKVTDGFYVIYYFDQAKAGETITNFERVCKYDENVIRQMTLQVPTKKKGQEVRQIVPEPGWLAEFSMVLRPQAPRRRSGDFGRGGGRGRFGRGPVPSENVEDSSGSGDDTESSNEDQAEEAKASADGDDSND